MRIILIGLAVQLFAFQAFAQTVECGPAGMVNKIGIERALGVGIPQTIAIVKVCDPYAKATVTSMESGATDTAYLKKTGGQWAVIDKGMGVDPAKLNIPQAAW
jgi:hypothetical protein